MNKLNLITILISIIVLNSTSITALPVSVETNIEVETYQLTNSSTNNHWVKIKTIENEYNFDCTLDRDYEFDIDFIKDVDCSEESDITNLTKRLVILSDDSIKSNNELHFMLNRTIDGCINYNKQQSEENVNNKVMLSECRAEIGNRYSKEQYENILDNYTTINEQLHKKTQNNSIGYLISFALGCFAGYMYLNRKFPKPSEMSGMGSNY